MRARAALFALMIVGVVAAPAAADRTSTARIDAPADGAVVTGSVDVRGAGRSVAGIDRIEILVDSWSVAVKEPESFTRDARIDYAWDTARWPADGSLAPNGNRTVVVSVISVDGDTDKASIEVVANNPPAVPAGLDVAADGSRVAVTWDANPEPDITGYAVERDSGNGFVEVARTTRVELGQTLVPGDYAYRVTAIRSSPVEDGGIASEVSAPVAVSIAAPRSGGGAVTRLRGGRSGAGALTGGGAAGRGSDLAALLSSSSLPDQRGLPPIPSPPGIPWGSYDEKLPYGKAAVPPKGGAALTSARGGGSATLLPADGLRWVAAGLLLLVCAGLALVTAVRDVAGPVAAIRHRLTPSNRGGEAG